MGIGGRRYRELAYHYEGEDEGIVRNVLDAVRVETQYYDGEKDLDGMHGYSPARDERSRYQQSALFTLL